MDETVQALTTPRRGKACGISSHPDDQLRAKRRKQTKLKRRVGLLEY
jgi:hypothetical protein